MYEAIIKHLEDYYCENCDGKPMEFTYSVFNAIAELKELAKEERK